MSKAYYNEHDPFAAEWLRQLILAGHIAPGDVDERSIVDVQPGDLAGYTQCHFFSGIGVWSYALRRAGWSDSREVWTGSCPCQPFSAAGKGKGEADERHLWPHFYRLIRECHPAVLFGEQVAGALVTGGSSGKKKNLQEMRDREIVLGVLRQLQRESPAILQGMSEVRGEGQEESQSHTYFSGIQDMAPIESRSGASDGGEASGETEGTSVFPGCEEHTGESGQGNLRSDGDSVLSNSAEIMECAISGSDRAKQGLHNGEHASSSLLPECDGECLGSESCSGSCESCLRTAADEERYITSFLGEVTQETIGHGWLDLVQSDLEGEGYALGKTVLGACSVGGPHIRQRLYFVADSNQGQCGRQSVHGMLPDGETGRRLQGDGEPEPDCQTGSTMADSDGGNAGAEGVQRRGQYGLQPQDDGTGVAQGDTHDAGLEGWRLPAERAREIFAGQAGVAGFWADADWILCRDGKYRPVESIHVKVVDGTSPSMGHLCPDQKESEKVNVLDPNANPGKKVQGVWKNYEMEGQIKVPNVKNSQPGRESHEQRECRLGDALRFLPQSLSLAKLYGDRRSESCLYLLRDAFLQEAALLPASVAAEEVWASLSQEAKNRVKLVFDASRWELVAPFPLSKGSHSRVGRLRGYGNAICAEVAKEFIAAYMETQ